MTDSSRLEAFADAVESLRYMEMRRMCDAIFMCVDDLLNQGEKLSSEYFADLLLSAAAEVRDEINAEKEANK